MPYKYALYTKNWIYARVSIRTENMQLSHTLADLEEVIFIKQCRENLQFVAKNEINKNPLIVF